MDYQPSIAAVSFGDTKAAALYFERVLPVAFHSLKGDAQGLYFNVPEPVPIETASKLIFGDSGEKYQILQYLDEHWAPFKKRISPLLTDPRASTDPDAYNELKQLYLSDTALPNGGTVRTAFKELVASFGIDRYSVLLSASDSTPADFSEVYGYLALSKIPMINTATATWEQISEVRANKHAIERLRRLRLFFNGNYVGKSRAFVEDDLLKRLDDYGRTRKEYRFDVLQSSLSVFLDTKTLVASGAAAITTALFGGDVQPLTAVAAVEFGKVALETGKKLVQIKRLHTTHDLAYLIDIRKALGRS